MTTRKGGFTLVELCMAMASVIVVLFAACQMLLASTRDFYFNEGQINLSNKISAMNRKVESEFVLSGGNFLPPWLSMKVENDCGPRIGLPDCNHSDRLSIATSLYDPVSFAFFPTPSVASYDKVNSLVYITFALPQLPCPVDNTLVHQHILMTNAMQTEVFALWTLSLDLQTCVFTVAPDVQGTILNSANFLNANYASGAISFVRHRTYFFDSENFILKYLEHTTNNPAFLATELHDLMREVYDFQAALGYDTLPHNGVIDDRGTSSDEILFNAPGDNLATLGGVGAVATDLRQLLVAIIIGETIKGGSLLAANTLQNFDGPNVQIPNVNLQSLERKIFFRNSMAYY